MTEPSVTHATIVLERVYDASPDRTFAAWSDPQAKARWYNGSQGDYELDFRVGGWEHHRGTLPDGREYAYRALFWDIVPGQRIVGGLFGRVDVSMPIEDHCNVPGEKRFLRYPTAAAA